MPRRTLFGITLLLVSLAGACDRSPSPGTADQTLHGFDPPSTRGYILISVDTLSALHLGAYGYDRGTSPFFDSLAAHGTLFEHATIQYPATLISHMCIFTGLYPREHGVIPPNAVLSPTIETFPERFHAHGFRTGGHTEGGYVGSFYGFNRGFDTFTDTQYEHETDVERTFQRGIDFIRGVEPGKRFLLFLHTYTVHDPYEPLEPYRSEFWPGRAPDTFEPTGPELYRFDEGFQDVTPEGVNYYRALYDASIRYFDDVLEKFFAQLDVLGVRNDTTIIITADHGEEFLEHGMLVHQQIYPETTLVPLLILFPGQTTELRIDNPVESVDIAPTLYDLAGIPQPHRISGHSLVPLIRRPNAPGFDSAYSEVGYYPQSQRALFEKTANGVEEIVLTQNYKADPAGNWYPREVVFDTAEPELDFQAVSFHEPRSLHVDVDGRPLESVMLRTTWTPIHITLPVNDLGHRVRLSADHCASPLELGLGDDSRCLAFQERGLRWQRRELYDLERDPWGLRDTSRQRPDLVRALLRRLSSIRFTPVVAPQQQALDASTAKTLKALGYIN